MSNYHKNLISTIGDSGLWPSFSKPDFIQILDNTAYESFNKQTTEGYLAAFLIYQQISEEMVKNIINFGRLFNQASVFPYEINYETIEVGSMTFGALINQLRTIPHKDPDLVNLCSELNGIRIQLIHKITRKQNLRDIHNKCQKALEIYKKIETSYFELEEEYRLELAFIKKDLLEEWKEEYRDLLS